MLAAIEAIAFRDCCCAAKRRNRRSGFWARKIRGAIKPNDGWHRLKGFVTCGAWTYDFIAFTRSRSCPMFSSDFSAVACRIHHAEAADARCGSSSTFMGMTETARNGQSVYLGSWRNFFNHDLVLTEGAAPGLKPYRLALGRPRCARRPRSRGWKKPVCGLGWHEGEPGRPRGYRYRSPGGHVHEIFWDCERWKPSKELAPTYPNRPQRYKPRGIAVNHIDHVTVPTQGHHDGRRIFLRHARFPIHRMDGARRHSLISPCSR